MDLKNKTAIVTGGTQGIGKAICNALAASGCNVIATGTGEKAPSENEGMKYLQLDLLDSKSINAFLVDVKTLGGVDILVNNAGINIVEPIDELSKDSWDKIMQVNLTGPMLLINAISKIMKKQKSGRILNVSSIWGVISKNGRSSYAASKTGLIGLTRSAALDLAEHNVLVNALCPGFTNTELTSSTLSQEEIESLSEQIPMKRLASVEEMANVALFLCSDINTYITGQTITADGGFTIQ